MKIHRKDCIVSSLFCQGVERGFAGLQKIRILGLGVKWDYRGIVNVNRILIG